jgi:predicted permease
MIQTFYVILPLILLVAIGHVATRSGGFGAADWAGIEKLGFRILLPALLIRAIAGSDLSLARSGAYVLVIITAFAVAGALTLMLRLVVRGAVTNPQLSTLFQATTRWNGLITLTIADQVFPENGLVTVTIAMGMLVPLINIANISALSVLNGGEISAVRVLKNIALNPLIIGCTIGLALNIGAIPLPQPVEQTLVFISRGALAVGLLAVGAGFRTGDLLTLNWQVLWAVVVKFALAPGIVYVLAGAIGLGPVETLCAMLVVATPTATNGYIVARQMGGDAGLYAVILNWQLVISVFVFPVIISLFAV